MKRILSFSILSAALACLAGLDYSDIAKWGLVRRTDLPADGYRMTCFTNVMASYVWTLNGSMTSTDEGYPTVLSCVNQVLPGLPMTLGQDGLAGLCQIGETGYFIGPFTFDVLNGFIVMSGNTDPNSGPACWTQGYTPGLTNYTCSAVFGDYCHSGSFTLTRTDYPDIVAVTTNYFAFGTGLVWRDMYDPFKFARLENGVVRRYQIVQIPGVWNFSGYDVPFLTQPLGMIAEPGNLNAFEPLANLRWQVRFDDAYRYYVYNEDEVTLLWISEPFLTNPAQTTLLLNGQGETENQTLMYIPAHSVTNAL